MIREAIRKIVDGDHLSRAEAITAMTEIMDGEATQSQVASFVTALRMRGETVDEITGFVQVMRDKAIKVKPEADDLLDTCGTGGDRLGTFNISTTATFVIVGAGITVAKHGNRAASSSCGSADVLEGLGVRLDMDADRVAMCIDKSGLGFMFAPIMHPAMRHAIVPRKEIGIRTVFNLLGPLTNPAAAQRQIVGVFSPALTEPLAKVLNALGSRRAMVVHGMDGLDEISTIGETRISEIKDGEVRTYSLHPSDAGLQTTSSESLAAGDGGVMDNVRTLLSVLDGEKGPCRDIVLLNAAAALVVADKVDNLKSGIEMASESIDSGAAMAALESFRSITQELAD